MPDICHFWYLGRRSVGGSSSRGGVGGCAGHRGMYGPRVQGVCKGCAHGVNGPEGDLIP